MLMMTKMIMLLLLMMMMMMMSGTSKKVEKADEVSCTNLVHYECNDEEDANANRNSSPNDPQTSGQHGG